MFNVGDAVKCVNAGAIYSTYDKWVEINADMHVAQYLHSQRPDQLKEKTDYPFGEAGTILVTAPHGDCFKQLYLVGFENDDVFLFDGNGLAKAE